MNEVKDENMFEGLDNEANDETIGHENMEDVSDSTAKSDMDEPDYTEEELRENEAKFDEAQSLVDSFGLEWNFRSIEYILEKRGVSFPQLRSCVFKTGENEAGYNLTKATRLIVEAGLVGSNQDTGTNLQALEMKAWEILEKWRNSFGFIGIFHVLMIRTMEDKHFFIGEDEMKVVQHLNYKNWQSDLALNLYKQDTMMRMNQMRALE